MTQVIIANMPDAALCDATAKAIKATEGAGFRAILLGSIFLRVRGDGKANTAILQTAIANAVAPNGAKVEDRHVATAANYVSKCRAAAKTDHFPWAVEVNDTLDAAAEKIMPEFRAYWGAINRIKAAGPEPKAKVEKGENATAGGEKPGEEAEKPALLAETPLLALFSMVKARLSEIGPDGHRVLTFNMLHEMSAAIQAELVERAAETRAAEATEVPDQLAA